MNDSLFLAVDLGAGSGRVFLAGPGAQTCFLEEVHRFTYPPSNAGGHLRWDFYRIFDEIQNGLKAGAVRARELGRDIESVGVDSWAVDYGLIDEQGKLLELPVCYRDDRTSSAMEQVFGVMPPNVIFELSGIQFQPFNTLFQLFSNTQTGMAKSADTLLLIPDLVNFFLTGRRVTEFTNATTTQMVNPDSGDWDPELVSLSGIDHHLLTEIVPAGTVIGNLDQRIARETGLDEIKVVAPATHDTGSAVAGTPLERTWAFISSGTWSLVGVEVDSPIISDEVRRHNFTNEGGVFGTTRFLKNVMGLWILEECRREWKLKGLNVRYDELLPEDLDVRPNQALIFPDDPGLFNPKNMLEALRRQLSNNMMELPETPREIARLVLDSLALRYASVIREIEELTGISIEKIVIVGGGSRNRYLNQATANACGKEVLAGPTEATVIGNVLVQAIAAGRFDSISEARDYVQRHIPMSRFQPKMKSTWSEAANLFANIEERFAIKTASAF